MKIYIDCLNNGYASVIEKGFAFLGEAGRIPSGARVAIKPNLTFPVFRKGVMTNPEAVEALVVYLKNFTDNITICESDSGGYNAFSMTEVFTRTGIAHFAKQYGVKVANMSDMPSRDIRFRYRLRKLSVPLPELLLDETDLFITMPVPKVHANTLVSLALKNQWGVIQKPAMRLKLHPFFQEVIYQVNKALPRSMAVVDGRFGLTRNGPMRGDVVDLNWAMISDNLFMTDRVVSELMGQDFRRIPYLRYIMRKEGIDRIDSVQFNQSLEAFRSKEFYLHRDWTDIPGLCTFKSRTLAYVGYESMLAKPLHWLLYKFREPFY